VKVALLALAACASRAPAPPPVTGPSPPVTTQAVTLPPGPGTAVATLAPGAATPVVTGPMVIIAINPGGNLSLAVAASCTGELTWFSYSGGGVAVGAGQVLCARNEAPRERTHGFSGEVRSTP